MGGIPPEPEPPVLNPDDIRDIIIKLKFLQEVERIEKKIKLVADSELRALIELAQRVEEDPANLQRLVIAGRWLRELMAREGMLGDPLDEIFPEQRLKREAMELLQRAREQVSEGPVAAELDHLILKFDALLEVEQAEWQLKEPALHSLQALAQRLEQEGFGGETIDMAWKAVELMHRLIDLEKFGTDPEQGPFGLDVKREIQGILQELEQRIGPTGDTTGGEVFILSGSPSPELGISVDDDLAVYVNGQVAFIDEDGLDNSQFGNGPLSPISFAASGGDLLQVVAIDTISGCRDLSPLYLHRVSDGAVQFLDEGVPQVCGEPGGETFFDKTFTIEGGTIPGPGPLAGQLREARLLVASLWEMERVAVKAKYLILSELEMLQGKLQDRPELGGELRSLLEKLQELTWHILSLEGNPPRPVVELRDPQPSSRIAFESDREGNFEIYVLDADGSNLTNLTLTTTDEHAPTWSPDASQIAFNSGTNEIWVMNADGSGQTNITNSSAVDVVPSWSPDGKRIAFYSDRDGNSEIYTMNPDGTDIVRLTFHTVAKDSLPAWSPDSTKLAFSSTRDDGQFEIYVIDADGSSLTRLTNNPAHDVYPAWSPDGTKIAFWFERDGNREIYVMNSDGSGQTRLTNNLAVDMRPDWSPDGRKIAFSSDRDGNSEIYVMDADGTNQIRFTNNPGSDGYPEWSPGDPQPEPPLEIGIKKEAIRLLQSLGLGGGGQQPSSHIVFQSDRDGNDEIYQIYAINADGSGLTRLTSSTGSDQHPSVSPDGAKITFKSTRDGGPGEIYVMNFDGSGVTRLTNNGADESSPSWCGNDQIAFASIRDGQWEIYIMDSDGSNQTRLTFTGAHETTVGCSVDGTKIAFDSARDGNAELYVMNADGTDQTRLTDSTGGDGTPEWSPNGSKISWGCPALPGKGVICVMNADSTGQVPITDGSVKDSPPAAWSPDGMKLAFSSDRDGDLEIYVMNADGSGVQRITTRDSPDQTNFPGYSSFWDTFKYNPAFQGRQMRPDSLKFPVFI